jgi:hypothetical protein
MNNKEERVTVLMFDMELNLFGHVSALVEKRRAHLFRSIADRLEKEEFEEAASRKSRTERLYDR